MFSTRRAAYGLLRSFLPLFRAIFQNLAASYHFLQNFSLFFYHSSPPVSQLFLPFIPNISNSNLIQLPFLPTNISNSLCHTILNALSSRTLDHHLIICAHCEVILTVQRTRTSLSMNCHTFAFLLTITHNIFTFISDVLSAATKRVGPLDVLDCTEPVVSQQGASSKALQGLLNCWFAPLNTIKNSLLIFLTHEKRTKTNSAFFACVSYTTTSNIIISISISIRLEWTCQPVAWM